MFLSVNILIKKKVSKHMNISASASPSHSLSLLQLVQITGVSLVEIHKAFQTQHLPVTECRENVHAWKKMNHNIFNLDFLNVFELHSLLKIYLTYKYTKFWINFILDQSVLSPHLNSHLFSVICCFYFILIV